MLTIKIIIASTRPNRSGAAIADWFFEIAKSKSVGDVNYELVDLKDINLPFLDEPKMPSEGNYEHEHTKKWANIVEQADGFVFVTPEYNHSFSASLKNAMDFLWEEWLYKPVAYVSYGFAGGARAVEQLRSVAGCFNMYDIRNQLMIVDHQQYINDDVFVPTSEHIKSAESLLKKIALWSKAMQQARQENNL